MSDTSNFSLQLKVLSWNINGIRTVKNLKSTLDSLGADILCLQETKTARDTIDEETAFLKGYNSYFSFSRTKSGYSGVATYCSNGSIPILAEEGLSGVLATGPDKIGCYGNIPTEFSPQELRQLDSEGRALITQHKIEDACGSQHLVHVINVYCPRADPERSERLQFKLKFYQLLEMRSAALRQIGHVIVLGDVNTSHREIDRCEILAKEEFESNPGRQWLNNIILDTHSNQDHKDDLQENLFQLVDSFRHFHPSQTDAYTCWNTQIGARATNYGSRIDYLLVNKELLQNMTDSVILSDVMGSDHCPVMGYFRLKIIPALKLPSLCSKYYPEFAGTQSTLSSFFSKNDSGSRLNEPQDKKPKLDKGGSSVVKRSNQSNILGFFQRKVVSSTDSHTHTSEIKETEPIQSMRSSDKPASVEAAAAWRQVLKGPQPLPLCSGHNEPSVERVVKKSGPNQNRRFWACARGEGRANDPKARCNFFKWASSK